MSTAPSNGITLYYEVHGQGPNLILIEGIGYHTWMWYRQLPALAPRFRTLIYDNRGVGRSDKPPGPYTHEQNADDLAGLLDHLGWEQTHVLGVSMGGFIAQEFALKYPKRVAKLVLAATAFGGPNMIPLPPEALKALTPDPALTPDEKIRSAMPIAFSTPDWPRQHPEEFEQIVRWRLADSPSLPNFYQQAMAGARFDASREVRSIVSPTLVIHGADDCYVPVANAVALAETIPGAKLRILEDAAHLVFIEQAKEVNKQVISFLKPSKSRRSRKKPQERPAAQERGFLFELRKRWRAKKLLTKQKTEQLTEWIEEVNEAVASFFKPQKLKNRPRSRRASARPKTKKPRKAYRTSKTRAGRKPRKAKGRSAYWKKIEGWLRPGR
jgi:pimeloyl-ACP methyl ester carboxylesterase